MADFENEWFDASDNYLSTVMAKSESQIVSQPSRLAMAVAVLFGLVVTWSLIRNLFDGPSEISGPVSIFDPQDELEAPPQIEIPDFIRAPFGMPASVVIATRHDGGPPLRLTVEDGQITHEDLPQVSELALDASGQWLAAVSRNATTDDQVLWVGPISGQLDPVAVGTQGFAWHDTTPGLLAAVFSSTDGQLGLSTITYGGTLVTVSAIGPTEGWLQSWGEWGFVVTDSQSGGVFDVLDASGAVTVENREGSVAGFLPRFGLIVSKSDASAPRAMDPTTGETSAVAVFRGLQKAWVVKTGAGGTSAVLASNLDEDRHVLLILDNSGSLIRELPAAGGVAPLWWDGSGDRLAFVRDDHDTNTELVVYSADADVAGFFQISYLDPFKHWSRAVALP